MASRRTKTPPTPEPRPAPSRKKARPKAAPPLTRRASAEQTRERIRDVALTLIRKKGFDATTMRDIAQSAHVSLGLAYHYFDSKEALALAFYGEHIERHDLETKRALASRSELRERIEAALLIGLDVRAADKAVLLVMARTVLDATNPISLFSERSAELRARSIGLFREVAEVPEIEESLKEPFALALWAMHLGVMLRFVHDESPGQRETRAIIAHAARLAAEIATLLSLPLLESMRNDLVSLFRQGGLLGADRASAAPPRAAEGLSHGTRAADAPIPLDPARPRPRGRMQRS
jgi:AcrR family transcriptional regulator